MEANLISDPSEPTPTHTKPKVHVIACTNNVILKTGMLSEHVFPLTHQQTLP